MSARRSDRRRLSRPRIPGELGEPVSVGDAAAMIGEQLGLAEPGAFMAVTGAWADLVGPVLAERSRVRSIRDGVLDVSVDSPAWATQVRFLESDLVARAAELLGPGVVASVRVSVDPSGATGRAPGHDDR